MKRLAFFVGWVLCVAFVCTLAVSSARAQTASSGSITGLVTDPQGSAVPGADVTLTDIATNTKQSLNTNDSGRYNFPVVNPGLYDIVVSKTGFKTAKMAQQKASIGLVLTVNVTLEVGSLSETVVITASPLGSELQSSNATIGNTINLKQLELLPNLGRDASTLMALQPGVTPLGNVAGAVEDQSTFTIDGGNNTDDMSGDTRGYITNFTGASGTQTNGMASGVVATPIETVEEFRVNTFGQTADFNSSAGAQVQMVTKRGTDKWHGSGYGYYFAPNIWGAQTWALNHTPFTKGSAPNRRACAAGTTLHSGDTNCVMPSTPIFPSHRGRFGFTVGGAIIPKKILGGKTYLFAAYEGFRFPQVATFERAYPTDAFKKGVIQVPDANNNWIPYNLNPGPVTVTVGNPLFTGSNAVRTVTLPGANGTCPATYTGAACDPRIKGLNPTITQLWNFLPTPNDPTTNAGDQFNTAGYLGTVKIPLTSNNYVGRIDHDFSPKERFFTSFRAFKLLNVTSNQVDVGGILGGTQGQYNATAPRPQLSELLVFGLTSTLRSNITNDFRASYLWNWWQWGTAGSAPQFSGLGGALEVAAAGTGTNAEATTALIPYNVNNQSVRQRVWDGQDKMLRDDVTWVKGNHLFQFGGLVQHNFDYHTRTDNGGSINNAIVYQIATSQINFGTGCGTGNTASCIPSSIISAQASRYRNLATSVLGLVGLTQVMYTRGGSDLHLLPLGTFGVEQSTIKTYNLYAADTWKIKPTLTLSYGLGYTYETPPVEKNGNQVAFVYADGSLVHTADYLQKRVTAALAGQVYNPVIGYETTASLHIKYPYTPFKKGFSPRVSVAWNPTYKSGFLSKVFGQGSTVIRGGYGRVFGRLNGVNQVLVPLLGPGILQAVSCSLPVAGSANCGQTAGGAAVTGVNPFNVFRIGTDGLTAPLPSASTTLPQPFLPGIAGNVAAGDAQTLDPDFRPNSTDNFDFTIQRQIHRNLSVEVGYMGRRIRNEYQQVNLNAIPYMTTLGGQQFANAYANVYQTLAGQGAPPAGVPVTGVPNQAFFETALGGAGSAYCNQLIPGQATGGTARFGSCTQAVATLQRANFLQTAVATIWNNLQGQTGSWILPSATLTNQVTSNDMVTSLGYGNYNAVFATLRMNDWHGMSAVSNFTWGRALGTTALTQRSSSVTPTDPFNLSRNYGTQSYDLPVIFNAGITYQPRSFFGLYDFHNAHGILGQVLNGWSIAPFITAQSGFPIAVSYSEGSCTACQAFGENAAPGVASISSDAEDAVFGFPGVFFGGNTLHRGVTTVNGVVTNSAGLNMFANPAAVQASFRPCVLGVDNNCGGWGNIRGFPRWNVDATIAKDFRWKEHLRVTVSVQLTNVLNHFQPSDPSLSFNNLTAFGVVSGQVYNPRNTEFGLRIQF
jgi:Carboxypeptidase regulatory-like domain